MTLRIICSARYIRIQRRVFDKITHDSWPKKYWFRLKIYAEGRIHKGCFGKLTSLCDKHGRSVPGFDALVMAWGSEPPPAQVQTTQAQQTHYRVDIPPGNNEVAGLAHVKLRDAEELPLEKQTAWDAAPEVQINRSRNEPNFRSKLVMIPYGEYFIGVTVSDQDGAKTKRIFRFNAQPDADKCWIRAAWFYERWRIALKSLLPSRK